MTQIINKRRSELYWRTRIKITHNDTQQHVRANEHKIKNQTRIQAARRKKNTDNAWILCMCGKFDSMLHNVAMVPIMTRDATRVLIQMQPQIPNKPDQMEANSIALLLREKKNILACYNEK